MTREDFIKQIGPYAKELGKEYNILPSLIMGVACHESNFGDSQLAKEGNNLFGVKGAYNGESVTLPTWEVIDGVRKDIEDAFRKYPTYKESMEDFCKLIQNGVSWNHEIYHSVLGVKDWNEVIEKFAKTPYMTDPAYEEKLKGITSQYKLYEYNEEPTPEPVPETVPTPEPVPNEATPQPVDQVPDTPTEPEPVPTAPETVEPTPEPVPTAPDQAEPTPAPETVPDQEKGTMFVGYPGRRFSLGSKGNYVKMIQEQLGKNLKIDGYFGPITASYVYVYQNENELSIVDGIVGKETWNRLFNNK
jgi:Mannosyl-glycoprotein endo-beta-N-acetylglucosaminidase/Putative peptidoglycan binding domain